MQAFNRRKNCHRSAANFGQLTHCTQKLPRVRCCGRVMTEQDLSHTLLTDPRGRGRNFANRQGPGCARGRGLADGQGQGRGRGRGLADGQGQGRGRGRGLADGQALPSTDTQE